MKIFQLYYDENSRDHCQDGFYPIMTVEPDRHKNPFMENTTIIEVSKIVRKKNEDYIGFVSWRLFQKTQLTYQDIVNQMDGHAIYSLSPAIYQNMTPMYQRLEIPGMGEICKYIDSKGILKQKLYNTAYPESYCNYWILTPKLFTYYVKNYLIPVIRELKKMDEIYYYEYKKGELYDTRVFVLEGLFGVFLQGREFKYIPER